jgi:hypothetical protein
MEARRLCRIERELGRVEECPEGSCPFWEPGGAVLDGRCAIDHVDLSGGNGLVEWLAALRRDLEGSRTGPGDGIAERLRAFHRLIAPPEDD